MNKYVKIGALTGLVWGIVSVYISSFSGLLDCHDTPVLCQGSQTLIITKLLFLPFTLSGYFFTLFVSKIEYNIFRPITNSWQGIFMLDMISIFILTLVIGIITGIIIGYFYSIYKSKGGSGRALTNLIIVLAVIIVLGWLFWGNPRLYT